MRPSLLSRSKRAIALAMLAFLQSASTTQAATTVSGTVVVPMSPTPGASNLQISFEERDNHVIVFTIQSHGLSSSDPGFFKVEGPLDCIRPVSTDGAIVSATVMGTAMNAHNFFAVGQRLAFALADNEGSTDQVSIIRQAAAPTTGGSVCASVTWDTFQFINVVSGGFVIDDSLS